MYENLSSIVKAVEIIRYSERHQYKNNNVLHDLCIKKKLSLKQVGLKLGVSKETIRKQLIEKDIELRRKSFHHGNPSQLKFELRREARILLFIKQSKELLVQ